MSPARTAYVNVRSPVPLPPAYVAFLGGSVASASAGDPATVTASPNATVMLIIRPVPYVPSELAEDTPDTCRGSPSMAMLDEAASEPALPGSGRPRSAAFPRVSATEPNVTSAPAWAYPSSPAGSPGLIAYSNLSVSVPSPDAYAAVLVSSPIDSNSDGAGSVISTGRSNSTSTATSEPAACVPFAIGEETPVTDAGERRISWMPSHLADATAYVTPPVSSVAMPLGLFSRSKPLAPSAAEPAGERLPAPLTRTSWIPPPAPVLAPADTATYATPPISNASMSDGPPRRSKPPLPWAAESARAMLPSAMMRTSVTPLGASVFPTTAYMSPPVSSTSTLEGPSSVPKPSSVMTAEPLAKRVPLGRIRISWMPSSFHAATTAYASSPRLNAATSWPPRSTSKADDESTELSRAVALADRLPSALTRASRTARSLLLATMTNVLPAVSNASIASARSRCS